MNTKTVDTPLHRLRVHMGERELVACIVSHRIHVGYLSSFFPPPERFAALLVTPSQMSLIAPSSADPAQGGELELAVYEDQSSQRTVDAVANALQAFEAELRSLGVGAAPIGLEPAHLPAIFWDSVQRCLSPVDVQDINPALRRMRTVKSDSELQAVERAVATCDRIFQAIEAGICAGATELDVYLTALRVVVEECAGPAMLDGDFVSGPRTEEIGGPPTPRKLDRGDLLIVDVYPRVGAYWADCTRTYVVGPPSQATIDRHGLLVEAIEAGERAIEPGRPTREVYQAVKDVLDRAGLGDCFPHHAGHGVGLTPSEEPRLIPGSDERLEMGMTITLEPGLYIPGQGGMRLEDNFLVTANGCRCLSRYPRKLVVLQE